MPPANAAVVNDAGCTTVFVCFLMALLMSTGPPSVLSDRLFVSVALMVSVLILIPLDGLLGAS